MGPRFSMVRYEMHTAGIHLVRRYQRARGAGINTSGATAATVLRQCDRRRQLEPGKNHAQEKPRPKLLVDDAGVLADPADSCIHGVDPLYQGTRVHIAPGREGTERLLQTLLQPLKARQQDVMVVGWLAGIARSVDDQSRHSAQSSRSPPGLDLWIWARPRGSSRHTRSRNGPTERQRVETIAAGGCPGHDVSGTPSRRHSHARSIFRSRPRSGSGQESQPGPREAELELCPPVENPASLASMAI